MKKRCLIVLGIIILIILFIVYLAFLNEKPKKSTFNITSDKISMEVNNITNRNAEFIITNHTDQEFDLGNIYYIDYEKDGIWYKLKEKHEFVSILMSHVLKANSQMEEKINWEYIYGELEEGHYRLIREIGIENSARIYVAAEFNVS